MFTHTLYRCVDGDQAQLSGPSSADMLPDGRLILCEYSSSTVRIVEHDGAVTTIVGKSGAGHQDGPVRHAKVDQPRAIRVLIPSGNILISDKRSLRLLTADLSTILTLHTQEEKSSLWKSTYSNLLVPGFAQIPGTDLVAVLDRNAGLVRVLDCQAANRSVAGNSPDVQDMKERYQQGYKKEREQICSEHVQLEGMQAASVQIIKQHAAEEERLAALANPTANQAFLKADAMRKHKNLMIQIENTKSHLAKLEKQDRKRRNWGDSDWHREYNHMTGLKVQEWPLYVHVKDLSDGHGSCQKVNGMSGITATASGEIFFTAGNGAAVALECWLFECWLVWQQSGTCSNSLSVRRSSRVARVWRVGAKFLQLLLE